MSEQPNRPDAVPGSSALPPPALPSPPPSPTLGAVPPAPSTPPQPTATRSPSPTLGTSPSAPPSPAPPPQSYAHSHAGPTPFVPLRADPPPTLFATWWLRYMLVLAQFVSIAVVVITAYTSLAPEIVDSPTVRVAHGVVAVLLVSWSALAMVDASRLVPGTRYRRRSSASVVIVLWLAAFAAPLAALQVVEWARRRFAADPDDMIVVALAAGAVAVCFLVVWLPFQYHTRQAHRIGAPGRVVAAWFWLPLLTAVGALGIHALGLHAWLAEDGFTDRDRMIQVAVVYGLPALTFALSTWRATTVFDEVIELRWLRWKTEWEQTLVAMAAQPTPAPEPSPAID